jgi:hypothetical protein
VLAGAVAVNVVVSNTTADVEGPDPIALTGNVTLTGLSSLQSDAASVAQQDTTGNASGVGASVAVNVVNDTTIAGISDGVTVNGVSNTGLTCDPNVVDPNCHPIGDLAINATSTNTMNTTAEGGASTGSGTVSLAAQAAIAISNVTTTANVGTGTQLTIGGTLVAHAVQTAKTTTKASGDTKGGNAAIGLSLGLGYGILTLRDIPFELDTGDVLWLVLGTPAMTAAWAAIGVGLGALVRNQVLAVIGLIVWAMVVDNLLRALVPAIGGYTPGGASAAVIADPAEHVLGAAAGGLLLLAYVAAFVAGGAFLVARRDVT